MRSGMRTGCNLILTIMVGLAVTWPQNVRAADQPLQEHQIAAEQFGADAPWYENNIPFFDSADPLLNRIYYYRWQIFRAHQRDLGQRGYISTEFLDDVGWQLNPYASLNDATGFHIGEGRWLRDRRYVEDYIDFMYDVGNDRHFSEAIADAAYGRFLVDGDLAAAAKHLPAMKRIYDAWNDHYDPKQGLYWVEPIADATEYTIASIDASGGKDGFLGGFAFRPTINSFMAANARAISRLSALRGDAATAADYAGRNERLRNAMLDRLWSKAFSHFIDRYKVDNEFVKYGEPIRGRELAGYLPWTYGLAPDDAQHAAAWAYLLGSDGLAGPAGLRTVGPSYENYMRQYRYDKDTGGRECQWNGPVWPFQTTQALTAMANLLADYHQTEVTRSDYMRLLRQYAKLHLKDGKPDLEEDYDPATGKAIVGLPRSHHYFHSGFDDQIITGLAGIRPREDDALVVDPAVPADPRAPQYLPFFALQSVPYHGHLVGVVYDGNGMHYGLGKGLFVLIDGKVAAHTPKIDRIRVPLTRQAPPPVTRRIDLAVNLAPSQYPKGFASVRATSRALHQALDGRVWFFPEIPNGWSTAGARGETQWFGVDFGKPVEISAAELSFFADDVGFAAPRSYRLEAWQNGRWVLVKENTAPFAGGVNADAISPVIARKFRAVFRLTPGKAMRLVEMKAF